MIYIITPEHFGLTYKRRLLSVVGVFAGAALLPVFSRWTDRLLWPGTTQGSLWNWTISDITGTLVLLVMYTITLPWWWSSYSYTLEVDDNTARVGRRVVGKGYMRCFRELKGGLFQGPRLELSEHGPLWVRFFGGVVVVPKGLPEYRQIKMQVSTWLLDKAASAAKAKC
jgi:hypothetical protein